MRQGERSLFRVAADSLTAVRDILWRNRGRIVTCGILAAAAYWGGPIPTLGGILIAGAFLGGRTAVRFVGKRTEGSAFSGLIKFASGFAGGVVGVVASSALISGSLFFVDASGTTSRLLAGSTTPEILKNRAVAEIVALGEESSFKKGFSRDIGFSWGKVSPIFVKAERVCGSTESGWFYIVFEDQKKNISFNAYGLGHNGKWGLQPDGLTEIQRLLCADEILSKNDRLFPVPKVQPRQNGQASPMLPPDRKPMGKSDKDLSL